MGGYRCIVCDWSPDAPSIYHSGLATGHGKRNMVQLSNGDYICQLCHDNGFDRQTNEDDEFSTVDQEFDEL